MAGTAWGLSHLPLNFVRGDTWGWFVVALGLGGVAGLFGREPKAKAQLKEKMFLVPFRVSGNIHLMRISKDGKNLPSFPLAVKRITIFSDGIQNGEPNLKKGNISRR